RGVPAGKGPALCLGYWDDDAANRELWTEDGWMRMGDLATIDDDGYLTVAGRTSDLIIRGGKNITAAQAAGEAATHPALPLVAPPRDRVVRGDRRPRRHLRRARLPLRRTATRHRAPHPRRPARAPRRQRYRQRALAGTARRDGRTPAFVRREDREGRASLPFW